MADTTINQVMQNLEPGVLKSLKDLTTTLLVGSRRITTVQAVSLHEGFQIILEAQALLILPDGLDLATFLSKLKDSNRSIKKWLLIRFVASLLEAGINSIKDAQEVGDWGEIALSLRFYNACQNKLLDIVYGLFDCDENDESQVEQSKKRLQSSVIEWLLENSLEIINLGLSMINLFELGRGNLWK